MESLSWNLYVQRKKQRVYDTQMRKNANPVGGRLYLNAFSLKFN